MNFRKFFNEAFLPANSGQFLDPIFEEYPNETSLLVFLDWLEDQNSPYAEFFRYLYNQGKSGKENYNLKFNKFYRHSGVKISSDKSWIVLDLDLNTNWFYPIDRFIFYTKEYKPKIDYDPTLGTNYSEIEIPKNSWVNKRKMTMTLLETKEVSYGVKQEMLYHMLEKCFWA